MKIDYFKATIIVILLTGLFIMYQSSLNGRYTNATETILVDSRTGETFSIYDNEVERFSKPISDLPIK